MQALLVSLTHLGQLFHDLASRPRGVHYFLRSSTSGHRRSGRPHHKQATSHAASCEAVSPALCAAVADNVLKSSPAPAARRPAAPCWPAADPCWGCCWPCRHRDQQLNLQSSESLCGGICMATTCDGTLLGQVQLQHMRSCRSWPRRELQTLTLLKQNACSRTIRLHWTIKRAHGNGVRPLKRRRTTQPATVLLAQAVLWTPSNHPDPLLCSIHTLLPNW